MGGAGSVIGPRVNRYIAVPGLGMVSWYRYWNRADRQIPANRALSVGVAPLTIGGSMSKARHSSPVKAKTRALCEEGRRRQLPARRAREALKQWAGRAMHSRKPQPRRRRAAQFRRSDR